MGTTAGCRVWRGTSGTGIHGEGRYQEDVAPARVREQFMRISRSQEKLVLLNRAQGRLIYLTGTEKKGARIPPLRLKLLLLKTNNYIQAHSRNHRLVFT